MTCHHSELQENHHLGLGDWLERPFYRSECRFALQEHTRPPSNSKVCLVLSSSHCHASSPIVFSFHFHLNPNNSTPLPQPVIRQSIGPNAHPFSLPPSPLTPLPISNRQLHPLPPHLNSGHLLLGIFSLPVAEAKYSSVSPSSAMGP